MNSHLKNIETYRMKRNPTFFIVYISKSIVIGIWESSNKFIRLQSNPILSRIQIFRYQRSNLYVNACSSE